MQFNYSITWLSLWLEWASKQHKQNAGEELIGQAVVCAYLTQPRRNVKTVQRIITVVLLFLAVASDPVWVFFFLIQLLVYEVVLAGGERLAALCLCVFPRTLLSERPAVFAPMLSRSAAVFRRRSSLFPAGLSHTGEAFFPLRSLNPSLLLPPSRRVLPPHAAVSTAPPGPVQLLRCGFLPN